jgi:hypothetical protein
MKKSIIIAGISLLSLQSFADINLKCTSYYESKGERVTLAITLNEDGGGIDAGSLKVLSSPAELRATDSTPKVGEAVTLSKRALAGRLLLIGSDRYDLSGKKLKMMPNNQISEPSLMIRGRSYVVNIAQSDVRKSNDITVMLQVGNEVYSGQSSYSTDMQFTCSK